MVVSGARDVWSEQNESAIASTSESDREGSSEGSLKYTVLTSSLDSGSSSNISLMVDYTSNCRMYKRTNFILVDAVYNDTECEKLNPSCTR